MALTLRSADRVTPADFLSGSDSKGVSICPAMFVNNPLVTAAVGQMFEYMDAVDQPGQLTPLEKLGVTMLWTIYEHKHGPVSPPTPDERELSLRNHKAEYRAKKKKQDRSRCDV